MDHTLRSLGINSDWNFTLIFAGLIMTRLSLMTTIVPFLVGKPVPSSIKMGFTVVMLIFLYPFLAPADHSLLPQGLLPIMTLFFKEAFYGITLAFAASIVFHAFEAAGGMVDNQRGAAQARLLIPQLGEQSSLFGNFNYLLGIVIFLHLGGHLLFLKAFFESYEVLPILSFPKMRPDFLLMTDEIIRMTGVILILSIQLSAPVLITIFIVDVILGLISKAAPSINVWELGFAVRGVLGVFIYFLSLGLIMSQMSKLSLGMVDDLQKLIHHLAL